MKRLIILWLSVGFLSSPALALTPAELGVEEVPAEPEQLERITTPALRDELAKGGGPQVLVPRRWEKKKKLRFGWFSGERGRRLNTGQVVAVLRDGRCQADAGCAEATQRFLERNRVVNTSPWAISLHWPRC